MDIAGYITIVLVAIAVVGSLVYRVHKGKVVIDGPSSALDAFWEATNLVATYAPAADQLAKTFELKKEERLEYVMDMVMSYLDDFDPKQLRGIIEAWVAENHTDTPNV